MQRKDPASTLLRSVLATLLIATLASACSRRSGASIDLSASANEGALPTGQVPPLPGVPGATQSSGPVMGALPGVLSRISVPAYVTGTLQSGDTPLPDGRICDQFVVNLVAGQSITIVARGGSSTSGGTMDMYLFLFKGGTQLAADDDSAGSLNSRIVYTATTSGPHIIRVTTFGSGIREGGYTLQTYAGALHTQT